MHFNLTMAEARNLRIPTSIWCTKNRTNRSADTRFASCFRKIQVMVGTPWLSFPAQYSSLCAFRSEKSSCTISSTL